MTECGGVIEGEAPSNRGGVREVSQHKGKPIITPHNMQSLQKHRCTEEYGGIWGWVHPLGHINVKGVCKHMGHTNVGHPDIPQV